MHMPVMGSKLGASRENERFRFGDPHKSGDLEVFFGHHERDTVRLGPTFMTRLAIVTETLLKLRSNLISKHD